MEYSVAGVPEGAAVEPVPVDVPLSSVLLPQDARDATVTAERRAAIIFLTFIFVTLSLSRVGEILFLKSL